MDGTIEPTCKPPCLKTKVHIFLCMHIYNPFLLKIFGAEISKRRDDIHVTTLDMMGPRRSTLDITFKQSVTVTEYFYPQFSFSDFLSSMGGALGLWLGLGVLQLTTNIVTLATWMKSQNLKQLQEINK